MHHRQNTRTILIHLLQRLFIVAGLFANITCAGENAMPERLTFGVFPFVQTTRIEHLFAPTASRFGEVLGIPVAIRSSASMQRFRERIEQQRYDLIFIQPFDYIRFAAASGYIPLASWTFKGTRDHPGKLNAVFVVRQDSSIQSLDDLQGKKIVAPPRESAVAILGELELRKHFPKQLIKTGYSQDHLSCLQQVASRHADVCICAAPPLAIFRKKHHIPLRVIHMSRWLPSSLYAVNKRIPEAQRKKLRKELLSWKIDRANDRQYLLNGVWSSLCPASDTDYDPVRRLWEDYSAGK